MAARTEGLRLHEIQVIGSHNSYHVRPAEPGFSLAKQAYPEAAAWDYSHAPLDVQLDRGVRSFELDINNIPGGFEVYHWPLIDFETTCRRFVDCLQVVRAWSVAHPEHVPISFLLEIKDEPDALKTSRAEATTPEDLDRLDEEIRSVFPEDALVTPDLVRGEAETLEAAVLAGAWPTVEETRGRVTIILHETNAIRDDYCAGRPSLEGRAMFVLSEPGRPDAAVILANDPYNTEIPRLVKLGYFVRTRADSGLRPNPKRRAQALASGAHVVSTDFPPGEADAKSGYFVALPGGVAVRRNAVSAPLARGVAASGLENPAYVKRVSEE